MSQELNGNTRTQGGATPQFAANLGAARWLAAVDVMDLYTATAGIRKRKPLGYLMALLLPLISLSVNLSLGKTLAGFPFVTFFPGILFIAFASGARAGVLALLTSALLARFFIVEPRGTLVTTDLGTQTGFLFFFVNCGLMVWLIYSMCTAYAHRAKAERDLAQMAMDLDARVVERTQALAMSNMQLETALAQREAVEAQNRQLLRVEAIGQLTGGVAHDFNNMVSVIVISLEMARRRLKTGDMDVLRYIDNALEGASRATSLTRSLLAFARQQPLEPAQIDANKLLSELSELLRRTLGETIILECVLAGGLWPALVDVGQLQNAIVNLALNARDAMPQGGKLTIETANSFLDEEYARTHAEVKAGQYVMITVTDTGAGIAPDILDRIFEPFFTTKEVGKGTGLGLSQVFGFMKQSSGHIAVYSEPGVGTAFKLYLPRDLRGSAPLREQIAAPVRVEAGNAPKYAILIVEDDAQVRDVTVQSLRHLGYMVHEACDGAAALDMLAANPHVHILLTDVVMPGMSGRQLADQVARLYPDIRILYTTGYTRNAIVHNGAVDNGVDLITKPFTIEQLLNKIQSIMDRP